MCIHGRCSDSVQLCSRTYTIGRNIKTPDGVNNIDYLETMTSVKEWDVLASEQAILDVLKAG